MEKLFALKGILKVIISYKRTPKDHISLFASYGFPDIISGDK